VWGEKSGSKCTTLVILVAFSREKSKRAREEIHNIAFAVDFCLLKLCKNVN
jgi:hypothetical protein